jgi:hypothetical protein
VLGEGERNGVKRKRSVPKAFSFKLFFVVVGLDRLDIIYYTEISIVEKYLLNQKSGFSLLRGSALLKTLKEV